jgi:hypothetical protein
MRQIATLEAPVRVRSTRPFPKETAMKEFLPVLVAVAISLAIAGAVVYFTPPPFNLGASHETR